MSLLDASTGMNPYYTTLSRYYTLWVVPTVDETYRLRESSLPPQHAQQSVGESAPDGARSRSIPNPSAEISDDYAKSMRLRGIDRCAVAHQSEPYGDDHSCVLHCLEKKSSLHTTGDPGICCRPHGLGRRVASDC